MQFYRLFSTIKNHINHLHIRNASASHASEHSGELLSPRSK